MIITYFRVLASSNLRDVEVYVISDHIESTYKHTRTSIKFEVTGFSRTKVYLPTCIPISVTPSITRIFL